MKCALSNKGTFCEYKFTVPGYVIRKRANHHNNTPSKTRMLYGSWNQLISDIFSTNGPEAVVSFKLHLFRIELSFLENKNQKILIVIDGLDEVIEDIQILCVKIALYYARFVET